MYDYEGAGEALPGPDAGLPPPPRPPDDGPGPLTRAITLVAVALVALLLLVGAAAVVIVLRPELDPRLEVHETFVYQQSVDLVSQYAEVHKAAGPDARVYPGEQSSIRAGVFDEAGADIHLDIEGSAGRVHAHVAWERTGEGWKLASAAWQADGGELVTLPIGSNGRALRPLELAQWRAADPTTDLGRGVRALIEGRTLAGVNALGKTLEAQPNEVRALRWRARGFEALGDPTSALADWRRLAEQAPDDGEARNAIKRLTGG